MRYVILIHRNPGFWSQLGREMGVKLQADYLAYVEAARKAGILVVADQPALFLRAKASVHP